MHFNTAECPLIILSCLCLCMAPPTPPFISSTVSMLWHSPADLTDSRPPATFTLKANAVTSLYFTRFSQDLFKCHTEHEPSRSLWWINNPETVRSKVFSIYRSFRSKGDSDSQGPVLSEQSECKKAGALATQPHFPQASRSTSPRFLSRCFYFNKSHLQAFVWFGLTFLRPDLTPQPRLPWNSLCSLG